MKRLKHIVINFLTKHLVKAITEDDILIVSGRDFLINRIKLSPEEIQNLKDDAETFKDSLLWRLISNEVKFDAIQRMGDKAVTPDDIIFGKAMLYDINLIRNFIENLSKK